MKSLDEYMSEVYEKYEKEMKQHHIYKTVKMKPRRSFVPLLIGVMSMLVIGVIFVKTGIFHEERELPSVMEEDGKKVYIQYLWLENAYIDEEYLNDMFNDASCIAIVSDLRRLKMDYKNKNGKILLANMNNVYIQKILKGEQSLEHTNIDCYCYGGEIALADLERDSSIDWKSWEKSNIGIDISDTDVEKTYFRQVPEKGIPLEEGKQYLVFMRYDEEMKTYEIFDIAYGIMEYNPETNQVKNIDAVEFEDFDWSIFE